MAKLKDWVKRNKEDILFGWGVAGTLVSLMVIIFSLVLMSMTEDLVGRVEMEVNKNKELQFEAVYYQSLADELAQTYEDSVPKQQYIQDIEYLESVILELRGQCETYNNKVN